MTPILERMAQATEEAQRFKEWAQAAGLFLLLAVLIFALIVLSSPDRECINPGADLPIYLVSFSEMDKAAGYEFKNLGGLTLHNKDGFASAIYLPAKADPAELVRITIHEIQKHGGPDIIRRTACPTWDADPCAKRVGQ